MWCVSRLQARGAPRAEERTGGNRLTPPNLLTPPARQLLPLMRIEVALARPNTLRGYLDQLVVLDVGDPRLRGDDEGFARG